MCVHACAHTHTKGIPKRIARNSRKRTIGVQCPARDSSSQSQMEDSSWRFSFAASQIPNRLQFFHSVDNVDNDLRS